MPIDIIMVTYNRYKFTKKTLEHLFERTKTPYRLIVVDNGSQDGTIDLLNKYHAERKIFKVVPLPNNLGLQRAKNIGFESVQSARFVDTDNDCLLPALEPDWLAQLNVLMDSHPSFAAISLRPQVLVGVGAIFREAPEVVENNVAGGSWRLMNRDAVEQAGGWEDVFENRREEWDICTKLRKNGYKVGYARDIYTYHMFGENWGYDQSVPHYHRPESSQWAKDQNFDPITMVPERKSNE